MSSQRQHQVVTSKAVAANPTDFSLGAASSLTFQWDGHKLNCDLDILKMCHHTKNKVAG